MNHASERETIHTAQTSVLYMPVQWSVDIVCQHRPSKSKFVVRFCHQYGRSRSAKRHNTDVLERTRKNRDLKSSLPCARNCKSRSSFRYRTESRDFLALLPCIALMQGVGQGGSFAVCTFMIFSYFYWARR